jgi:hypothetical protein
VSAEELANLFMGYGVRSHGMLDEIASDRDERLTSGFWKQLMHRMGTQLCTAFHPQSDGQTERIDRLLEDMYAEELSGSNAD